MAKSEFILEAALKSQQWERAKGELRALVAIQGSYTSPLPKHMQKERPRWELLNERIEAFIQSVEGDALQE
jgi:hypothetical protein